VGGGATITVLAGGVGAARFIEGLDAVIGDEELSIIVNTGDDEEFYGLHVSPDIDIVTYTLAGLIDHERGWGISGDTFDCQEMLGRLGCETWFRLGDRDLAVHIYRTWRMRGGASLGQVTSEIASMLGVRHRIMPMSNEPVRTHILTKDGLIPFQRYLVERGARDEVQGIKYLGIEEAKPAEGVLESIMDSRAVLIAPSNPLVSIGTILGIRGVRAALRETPATILAVSPIVGGGVIKGPADKMMRGLGIEVSALSVARLYSDFLDIMIIDSVDEPLLEPIRDLGLRAYATNTVMKSR